MSPGCAEDIAFCRNLAEHPDLVAAARRDLRGHDLACWWDLDDRRQRAHLYEIVLREGTVADVRHFIDPDLLAELGDDLFLPGTVRRAWAGRLPTVS